MSLVALTSSTTLNRREAVQLAVNFHVSYRLSQSVWQILPYNKKKPDTCSDDCILVFASRNAELVMS